MGSYSDEQRAVEDLVAWLDSQGALNHVSRVAGGWVTGVSVESAHRHLLVEGAQERNLRITPNGRYTCYLGEHSVAGASLTIPTRHILIAVSSAADIRYPWTEQQRTLAEGDISYNARRALIALGVPGITLGSAPESTPVVDTLATLLGDELAGPSGDTSNLDIGLDALTRAAAKTVTTNSGLIEAARMLHAREPKPTVSRRHTGTPGSRGR